MKKIIFLFLLFVIASNLIDIIPHDRFNLGDSILSIERQNKTRKLVFEDSAFFRNVNNNARSIERQLRKKSFDNLAFFSQNFNDTLNLGLRYFISIKNHPRLLSKNSTRHHGYALIFALT